MRVSLWCCFALMGQSKFAQNRQWYDFEGKFYWRISIITLGCFLLNGGGEEKPAHPPSLPCCSLQVSSEGNFMIDTLRACKCWVQLKLCKCLQSNFSSQSKVIALGKCVCRSPRWQLFPSHPFPIQGMTHVDGLMLRVKWNNAATSFGFA